MAPLKQEKNYILSTYLGPIIWGLDQKNRKKSSRGSVRRKKYVKKKMIDERSKEINERNEYGHWEEDTIRGARGSKAVLLTLTERKSSEELIFKLESGKQEEVKKVFDELEDKYGDSFRDKFKTITFDNGTEFLNFEEIEKSNIEGVEKRTEVYYAHPYSSWERSINENSNRLIRRFIPKGKSIERISKKRVKQIER